MRKILFGVLIAIACSAGAALTGLMVHDHSTAAKGGSALAAATLSLTGTLSSTKACASGYVRAGPNYCQKVSNVSLSTHGGSCTAVTLPDASAKALVYQHTVQAMTGNAISLRQAQHSFWDNSSCVTTNLGLIQCIGRENPAETAGAGHICVWSGQSIVPVPAGGLWENSTTNGGSGSANNREIRGYFD